MRPRPDRAEAVLAEFSSPLRVADIIERTGFTVDVVKHALRSLKITGRAFMAGRSIAVYWATTQRAADVAYLAHAAAARKRAQEIMRASDAKYRASGARPRRAPTLVLPSEPDAATVVPLWSRLPLKPPGPNTPWRLVRVA